MLIVAPLSILGVWEEEFQKFAAFPYALAVLSGSSAKKLDTLRHMTGTALQVVVVNYESAWRLEKALTAWHPDLIIADEGHKIKTHNIAASKAMHRMGREASYRQAGGDMRIRKGAAVAALLVAGVLALGLWRLVLRGDSASVFYGNVEIRQVDVGFRVGGRLTDLLVE